MELLSRTRGPALVTLIAVLCPAPAWGLEFTLFQRGFTLDLTDTLTYAYNADNRNTFEDDDEYHLVLNKLDINLSLGDLRLGGRFDMYLYAGEPEERDDRYVNRFAPQQVYFMVARPEFDVTMGDFYATLGKGIALSVVKIDELGQDTTIRGGKFTYHDHGLGVTFLAGQFNPLALDSATGWVAAWDPEPLVAGRLEYNFFEKVLVGAHVMYHFIDDPGSSGAEVARTDHDVVWGVGVEIPELFASVLSLAAEVDLQQSVVDGVVIRGPGGDGGLDGIAAYASASSQLGDLTLLAEYKYYDNFELRARSGTKFEPYPLLYHHPPTLERLTADIKDNTSIWGAHLRADYNLGQRGPVELLVAANYGYFEDWAEGSDLTIHDPFGSIEVTWQEGKGKLEVESGVRRTYDNDNDKVKFQDIHLELNMEQSLATRHSLKLTFSLLQRSRAEFISEDEWKEMDLALTYKWSPHLLLAFTVERQEDPREVREPENYFGGVARYYITTSTYINVRGGQNRGGIKCYLGTCRYVPPFSGAEVQAVVRY